jgi:hypothetical protein
MSQLLVGSPRLERTTVPVHPTTDSRLRQIWGGGFDIGLRSKSCKKASSLRKQHNKIHNWMDAWDHDLRKDVEKRKWTYKLQDAMYV